MIRTLIAAAVLVAFCLPGGAIADANLQTLFQREQTSLASMPERHIKSLLNVSKPRARVPAGGPMPRLSPSTAHPIH